MSLAKSGIKSFMNRYFVSLRIAAIALLVSGFSASAQTITINAETGGLATSPLNSGVSNRAILGVHFAKAGGGANAMTALTVTFDQNPTLYYTNPRLYRSTDNNSFGAPDLGNTPVTGTLNATSAVFGAVTTFGNGGEDQRWFLVVDVLPSVNSTLPAITGTLSTGNMTTSDAKAGGPVVGPAYSFADVTAPTVTFNPLNGAIGVSVTGNLTITFNEPVRKLDDSPLVDADLAGLVAFKLTNSGGATVPFTATINVAKTVITVDPNATLASTTVYFLEISPVEDLSGNAITAQNITFTTADAVAPTVTSFNPANAATNVSQSTTITINLSEPIRGTDNSGLDNANIASKLALNVTNSGGATIPFTATINGSDDVITITPSSVLPANTVIYVALSGVEDFSDNTLNPATASITFTTGDTEPPNAVFNPANGAVGVSLSGNLTITFNEAIRKIDNSAITAADLLTLVELKLTDNSGAVVPFVASIDGTNTIVTIDPVTNLTSSTLYYLEINPVEDANNNATTAQNITFTTVDVTPPVATFSPVNGATNVSETGNITITFNENVRDVSNATLDNTTVDAKVSLRLTNAAGPAIAFDATYNAGTRTITIDPTAVLPSSSVIYVAISDIEDNSDNAITPNPTSITFTTGDTQPPVAVFSPLNGTVNVSVLGNLTITFNEPVRQVNDSPIDNGLLNALIDLRETNAGGAVVAFSGTIDASKQVITINPTLPLKGNQVYFFRFNVLEDNFNNPASADITFTTEPPPTFGGTPFSTTTTCVGDQITISGNNFGSAPSVTVNGVTITGAPQIVSATNTQIVFVPTAAMAGSGLTVTVTNTNNTLSAAPGTTITLKAAIDTTIPTSTNPASPSVNQNFSVLVGGASQSGVSYRVQRPAGTFTSSQNGNGSQLTFGTFSHNAAGVYTYKIEASSSGCTTKFFPDVVVNIIALDARAGGDKTTCAGTPVTIGGSPAAIGGTGFHQYSWTGPGGFTSTLANPSVTTAGTYTLTVEDNSGATDTDDVLVTVNPAPSIGFSSSIRRSFSSNDQDYRLDDKIVGDTTVGVKNFTGTGVYRAGDGKFYFSPSVFSTDVFGVQLTYTQTLSSGCSTTVNTTFDIVGGVLTNIPEEICSNVPVINGVFLSPALTLPAGKSVSSYRVLYLAPTSVFGSQFLLYTYLDTLDSRHPFTFVNSANRKTYKFDPFKAGQLVSYSNQIIITVFIKDNVTLAEEPFVDWPMWVWNPGAAPGIALGSDLSSAEICEKAPEVELINTFKNLSYTTINFSINDGPDNSIRTSGAGAATQYFFNPDNITFTTQDSIRRVISLDYLDRNGCANTTTRTVSIVRQLSAPISNDSSYCRGTSGPSLVLKASSPKSNSFRWYEDASLNNFKDAGAILQTGLDSQTDPSRSYWVTQVFLGCESLPEETRIIFLATPSAVFTPPPICEDRTFTMSGPSEDVTKWKWEFGDVAADTSVVQNPSFMFPDLRPYRIALTVTSADNCPNSYATFVTPNPNPIPNFTHKLVCDGDFTQFTGSTDNPASAAQFRWNFGDGLILPAGPKGSNVPTGNPSLTGTYQNPGHRFPSLAGNSPQTFTVTMTAINLSGCSDSVRRSVTILPYFNSSIFNADSSYVMSGMDGGRGFWSVEDVLDDSTWFFAQPQKTFMTLGQKAWVTDSVSNYAVDRQSYVNSPCFDLTGFTKPTIALNYFSDLQTGADGATLQYSSGANAGDTWITLGDVNSGINWFNREDITLGTVGISDAWSSADRTWLEAKRILDNVPNKSKVRLRVVFFSGAETTAEGFGFYDVRIEERNRTILLENFTNLNAPNYTTTNTTFTAIPEDEVVKLQYHLPFPSPDSIYSRNPEEPGARAAYYGLNKDAQLVPKWFVDGSSLSAVTSPAFQISKTLRSLRPAPYEIDSIFNPASGSPAELTVSIRLRALQPIIGARHRLHIAIAEKTVGDNIQVVRKMIPDALGTLLPTTLAKDEMITIGPFVTEFNREASNLSNLAIVAFVQEESTKDVLQAKILSNPLNLPSIVTGIEDPGFGEQISIYPNPTEGNVVIELPHAITEDATLTFADGFGRLHSMGKIKSGETKTELSTDNLASGVYTILIKSGKGTSRKKLVVVH